MSDRFWTASYPRHIPADINAHEYQSVCDLLAQACATYPSHNAYVNFGKALTYAELFDQAKTFAAFLQARGVGKGDRVAIMLPNCLQYPVALFGTHLAGAVVVNVNPLYTKRELKHQLNDSGATTIVVLENFAALVAEVKPDTKLSTVVVARIGDMLGLKGQVMNAVLRFIKRAVPAWRIPDAFMFKKAMGSHRAEQWQAVKLTQNDLAFLQYTGGTTGVAKGAMLSHGNMVANVVQARAWLSGTLEQGKEVVITALPLYHIFSLTANCLIFMTLGGTNVLITNPRDFKSFVHILKKHPFTVMTGVNTLFNALLHAPGFKTLNFKRLKLTLGGGMAVQRSVAEHWKNVTRCELIEAYGLTETSPAVCINPMDGTYNGSIGLPIPSTDVTLRDSNHHELPVGETGEIAIKGPQVMQGYWQRPEDTANTMTADGAFLSGDMGYMDAKGFVFLTDRKKDMILVSGFNVYPNEVEDAIAMHEGVLEVAAVGVPDERSGELVKVFVVKKDQGLTEKDVIDFAREQLTGYKVPKQVEFKAELPKSNVGKILRRKLRESL